MWGVVIEQQSSSSGLLGEEIGNYERKIGQKRQEEGWSNWRTGQF
jgi:hypothetical protein